MPAESTSRRSPYSRLLDKATRILAMRDHSEQELRRKLATQPTFPGKPRAEEDPFTPEDIEKVTHKFFRSNTHSWDNSMGLGLALVSYILKLHNTNLDIQSTLGEGSDFCFKLP